MSDTTDSGRLSLRTSNLKTSSLSLKTSSLNIHIEGGGETITIDPALDDSSTNAVQNKVIKAALDTKAPLSHTHTVSQITDLNSVLGNKQDKLESGTNIKTINGEPLLGEGNITIEGGEGSITVDKALDSTSANPVENKAVTQALNTKANISSVPTKTSDLQNDSGFITAAEVPSGSSNFIGTFASENDLPQSGVSAGNYAYVGSSAPYSIYSYNGTTWSATGATVDTNNLTADEEDITASETSVLSLKDRNTVYSSKAYVRVRKNLQLTEVKKTYSNVTWVHGIESVDRGISHATASSGYNFDTEYFEGNPAEYNASTNPNGKSQYGKEERFPFATKPATSTEPARLYKSVRKAAPFIVLNTTKNRVYFKWQWNTGEWAFSDIYYDEWAEKPSDVNFDVDDDKVFAYMDKGTIHYIKRTNGVWEEPDEEKETITINYLASDAFNQENTIYEIAYDMDLNGNTIKPALGVVLKYAGGKIKNGTIDFSTSSIDTSNPVIIDCPDVQFFENVKIIKSFSQVMKDVWFDDIWMAITVNPDDSLFACTAISLSKNHKIDFKYGEIAVRDKPARKLTIYGNGNKLIIDNTYRPSSGRKVNNQYPTSWSRLFGCSAIAIYDLTIELVDKTIQTYDSIFVSSDVFLKNVVYRGYSRFAANWDNDGYSLSALELHDCDLRATSFIFENSYNKVRFYNSQLRYLNPRIRHYYELISIGAYVNPALVENCNVEAYDTYIGGVWELGDRTKVDGVVNGYGYMKFHNCELVTFTTNNSQKTRGITDVIYEDCHFKTCDLPWRTSCIGTVTYKNCWFDIFGYQVGMTDAGPFDFWNIKSATFEGCTFNNTSFTNPEVTVVDGTSYPQGYTYPPYSGAIITIAPPTSIVTSGTGDVQLADGATWDFKLYLLNNRIMVNNTVISGYSYRPYSHFAIRTVNPNDNGAANKVILTDDQVKDMIVSRGNTFVHSISGTSGRYYESVGCHMYFNSRENVIPVDNTVFTVPPSNIAARDIDYENAYFGYCNTNFTFIDAADYVMVTVDGKQQRQYTEVPRYGRYNAATNKVAWLTYSAEEDVPANT